MIALGFVSFFNDIASDIVVPLVPLLLATTLGAGPIALGLIEGVADSVASLLKLWAGRRSDLSGGKRKSFVLSGYVLSNLARPLLGIAGSWLTVLALRSVDRVGKGVRSAPRDAMIGDITPPDRLGAAFGLHRALDNAGAMAGALAAAAAIAWLGASMRGVVLGSFVPGVVAVILLAAVVRDAPPRAPKPKTKPRLSGALSPTMRRYLMVLGLFTFARASETFVMLRGHELGVSTPELLVLWAALSAAKSASAYAGGGFSDAWGRRRMMLVSWALLGAGFVALGAASSRVGLWLAAIFYALIAGASEGTERAIIDELASDTERGTAFGWYYLVIGAAAIPAGLAFGALWKVGGASWAYALAGAAAALSATLLFIALPRTA